MIAGTPKRNKLMRYCLLILLFCFSPLVFAVTPPASQQASGQEASREQQEREFKLREKVEKPLVYLIRNIVIEGFVLEEQKGQFVKLFKPYRNKYLSAADIDTILQQLQEIYEQAGYQGLISIEPHIKKKCLTFTVSLIK